MIHRFSRAIGAGILGVALATATFSDVSGQDDYNTGNNAPAATQPDRADDDGFDMGWIGLAGLLGLLGLMKRDRHHTHHDQGTAHTSAPRTGH